MSTWTLTVRAQLATTIPDTEAYLLGRLAAEPTGTVVLVSSHDTTIGITVTTDTDDPITALSQLRTALARVLTDRGHAIVSWQAFEALTPLETDRRLEAATIPPLVNTERFAAICSVSRQRISELEMLRRRDEQPDFPTPVVPGWWLRTAAEHYAATRKRKPGPAPAHK